MYRNLSAQMASSGITNRAIAECLGIHENSVGNKLSGKSSFTIEEAFKIKVHFFPGMELEYLFRNSLSNSA